MDFRPTDQQRLLAGVAREFLDKRWPLAVAQDAARERRRLPDEVWRELSALGWPGLLVPATLGGSEATLLDVVVLVEEMGRAALPGPYVPSAVVATSILALAGTPAQQERLLPAMALGERVCTLGIADEPADGAPLAAHVGGTLDGATGLLRDADVAHHLIVVCDVGGPPGDPRRSSMVLVDMDRPGVRLRSSETMAGDRLFEVRLAGIPLRREDLVGPSGGGRAVLAAALARGAVARAAEMVGAAQRILELTVEYAKVRVQSGRPIGAFQAIQHTCADLLRDVEVARGVVYHAAWALDTGRDATGAVATAKAYAGRACLAVARHAHQVFGAIGFSEEHPLHLLHKRIHAAAVDCGDRTSHLETVARAIGLA